MHQKYKIRFIPFLFLVIILFIILLSGCSKPVTIHVDQIVQGQWFDHIETNKARYNPRETVTFQLQLKKPVQHEKLIIYYKHLDQIVEQKNLYFSGNHVEWQWETPKVDNQGYLAEVFLQKDSKIIDHKNIAVDVSTDWGKFPRYGFLSNFSNLTSAQMESVVNELNRYHINGIQFYDWQDSHHIPLKITNEKPLQKWADIANRPTFFQTVNNYIQFAHDKNMKAMNYNLLYGAYADAEIDGVKKKWGLFKDIAHENQDHHPLPSSWEDNINLENPLNLDWQNYLFTHEKQVFQYLPFDGWHVDQLGNRGSEYTYDGKDVYIALTYLPFLQQAKKEINVDYVMNAVNQFGQVMIVKAPVKFLYTEVWDPYSNYQDLKLIINDNWKYSNARLNTVLAAYMNYNLSNTGNYFNTPGVLTTDAVIFASGGAHLELGDHMLSKEYFPFDRLKMTDSLKQQLKDYYDFLVAYENLLRDHVTVGSISMKSTSKIPFSQQAEQGEIWIFARHKDNQDIVHLINFTDATTMKWRDNAGTQAEPSVRKNIGISMISKKPIKKIWLASPDFFHGSMIPLSFKQVDGKVTFTVSQLKYWDMVVIDYGQK